MFEALMEELTECSPRELDQRLSEAELAKREADARVAGITAFISARGSFRDHGYQSVRTYLKGTLNCSGTRANKIRKRAVAMNDHPSVGDALVSGRIGTEQADLLAKADAHPVAGELFAEFEAQLVDHAEHLEFSALDTVVTHFINQADPDGSFDDQRFREEHRTASVAAVDGSMELHASGGSPVAAAEMKAVFDAAVHVELERDFAARRAEHGDGALVAPLPRSTHQRKFDALHAIFMGWATAPADGRTPEPLVNVVIDDRTFGRLLHDHGLANSADVLGRPDVADCIVDGIDTRIDDLLARRCSVNATPVHPDVALTALIAGRVRRAVVDADNVVIDLGRTSRLFTGRSRDAARLLVVSCTHPGCDIPAQFCDIDHRVEWVAGDGRTDQRNGMPLCGVHDRWKHANSIHSRRAANGRIYLIRPDCSVIKAVGETDPDWSEPDPTDRPVGAVDPLAAFGRPMTIAELAGRNLDTSSGWSVRVVQLPAA